jgi:hypothetical protein
MSTKHKAKGAAMIRSSTRAKRKMPKEGKYPSNTSIAVTAPSAVSTIQRKSRSNPVRIVMTEEASDVQCTEEFENSALIVNPGNEDLFPWLAPIAQQFSSFQWNKITHEIIASCDTSTSGSVMMAVNADPDKPPFSSEKEVLNHEGSATASPWASFSIDGRSKSTEVLGKTKYVQDVTGEVALGTILDDLRTVATGVLNVASVGLQLLGADGKPRAPGSTPPKTVGKLLTHYDVTLWDPVDQLSNPDEGVSMFISSGASTALQLMSIPVPFQDGDTANPLRIVCAPSPTVPYLLTQFGVTEPGVYTVIVQIHTNHAISTFDVLLNPVFSVSGSNPPVILQGSQLAFIDTTGRYVLASATISFPDGSPDAADLTSFLNVDCTYPISTYGLDGSDMTYISFTQVGGLFESSFKSLYKKLPIGRRGCLPDCKRSAVISHLRENHRTQLNNEKKSVVMRTIKSAGRTPCNSPAPPVAPVRRGTDEKDGKEPPSTVSPAGWTKIAAPNSGSNVQPPLPKPLLQRGQGGASSNITESYFTKALSLKQNLP